MPGYLGELRKRGLSLRKFAQRVGLSVEWVSKIFNGEVSPSAATEQKIKDALCKCPWCGGPWPEKVQFESEPRRKTARG